MLDALLAGVVAGYGIAIPVGAIAVLIVDTGMRCGFRCAAFAGAGAATADLLYASVAVIGGAAVASALVGVQTPVRLASAAVLVLMAAAGLRKAGRPGPGVSGDEIVVDRAELARTYAKFVGLTVVNPLTVVYFTVLVIGMGVADSFSAAAGAVFVAGAFAASLSWQVLLAGVGASARRRLPARFRVGASVFGNLIVLGLAAAILLR
ncbi:MAG TPA: LysE family transporter [Acidimicrobiia bacterium]|nr:LysE family transporter [Acidimicrobiia bacterium]